MIWHGTFLDSPMRTSSGYAGRHRSKLAFASLVIAALLLPTHAMADEAVKEWRYFGGDAAGTRYVPFSQINAQNVDDIKIAWTWDSPDNDTKALGTTERPSYFKSTPLFVDGVLYTGTAFSQVAAIKPDTGETLWLFDPKAYATGRRPANTGWQNRGISFWSSGNEKNSDKRVFIATGIGELIAIDAATGKAVESFGVHGRVDLAAGIIRNEEDRKLLSFNSPPLVVGDAIIVGNVVADAVPEQGVPAGLIQAFDVRTGKPLWKFRTVPSANDAAADTWLDDAVKVGGAANAWAPLSADLDAGIVYAATGSASNDFYGGDRPGDNLYAESILAIDVKSGKLLWHFQGIHHGLWDYDFPAAPTLVDISVAGKEVKALAQVGKDGFIFVLDRLTGEPVWPITERPVPQSAVPGERTSPTQPFPSKPPAISRQGLTMDDLIDFTPELRKEAENAVADYALGGLFTPPILNGENGKKGVIMSPAASGGGNWAGAGFDPELGYLFLDSSNSYMSLALQPSNAPCSADGTCEADAPAFSRPRYELKAGRPPAVGGGLPITKPPYGTVVAIDLHTGDIAWQVPNADGPRDLPSIAHLNLPPLGASRWIFGGNGPLITKTLLFMNVVPEPGMSRAGVGGFLRAYDKRSGELVWQMELKSPPNGVPMTYEHGGKQYIVYASGGGPSGPAQLVALTLPN